MKKLITMAVLITALTCSFVKESSALKLVFQTRAHGKDCDKDRGFCFALELDTQEILALINLLQKNQWTADVSCNGNELSIKTLALEHPWSGEDFTVDSDIKLPTSIAEKLGYHSIVLKSGVYPIDYANNKQGDIKIQVVTN